VSVEASADITDLTVHDHACLTFGEAEELADLTAAFVRDGLTGGSRVVWLSDTPHEAAAELDRRGFGSAAVPAHGTAAGGNGPITVVDCKECLTAGEAFEVERAVGWLREQVAMTERQGYDGLRIALDMGWALRPIAGIEQLPVFEQKIAALVGERAERAARGREAAGGADALSVLCQYDRDRFDPVTLASVTPFHTHSVAAATYHDDELLRICRQYAPPGIRIAGQIDVQAQEPLALALAEAIRVDGDITVNMAELAFIDVSTTRMILETARSIGSSRRMVLLCDPAIESRFVILGAAELPNVDMSRR
jgi:anti-anti-sigma regulatory factor